MRKDGFREMFRDCPSWLELGDELEGSCRFRETEWGQRPLSAQTTGSNTDSQTPGTAYEQWTSPYLAHGFQLLVL